MRIAKRISITTERSEIFTIRFRGETAVRGFCAQCAEETEILTLDQAVSLAAANTREVIRRIDAGQIHALETASGHLLICGASLQNF